MRIISQADPVKPLRDVWGCVHWRLFLLFPIQMVLKRIVAYWLVYNL